MRLPKLRTVLLTPLVLFAIFYLVGVIFLLFDDDTIVPMSGPPTDYAKVVIFGASGSAVDGILKAALADPVIE